MILMKQGSPDASRDIDEVILDKRDFYDLKLLSDKARLEWIEKTLSKFAPDGEC